MHPSIVHRRASTRSFAPRTRSVPPPSTARRVPHLCAAARAARERKHGINKNIACSAEVWPRARARARAMPLQRPNRLTHRTGELVISARLTTP
jgi:hypothetical protein